LITKATNTIYQYFIDTTEKFKMDFRFSPMISRVDKTDDSFDSSLTNIYIHKRIYPIVNSSQTFDLRFNNRIKRGSVYSSFFDVEDKVNPGVTYESAVKDDGQGKMQLIQVATDIVLQDNIGIVDYETGNISITIFPYSLPPDTLDVRVYATPEYKNIVSGNNQIIIPDKSPVNYDVNRMQGVSITIKDVEIDKG
jgi:hypothetical protein